MPGRHSGDAVAWLRRWSFVKIVKKRLRDPVNVASPTSRSYDELVSNVQAAMPWIYSQSTGELTHDGVHAANGYSGIGVGRNNPAMQSSANVGPIPQGTYTIGAPRASIARGRWTIPLLPDSSTNTFGRSGLLIHADSIHHPGQASTGCIILPPPVRHDIASSADRVLEVVQ